MATTKAERDGRDLMAGTLNYPNGRCTADSKSTGERCKQQAVPGKRVCRYHGGRSKGGVEAPNYKHGRNSKYKALGERIDHALSNPDILSLRPEIALLDVRLSELVENLAETNLTRSEMIETGRMAGRVQGLIEAGESPDVISTETVKLCERVVAAASSARDWQEIGSTMERRRRMVQTEQRVLEKERYMIPIDEAAGLVSALLSSVLANVPEPERRERIQRDFASSIGTSNLRWLTTGSAEGSAPAIPATTQV